MKAREVRKRFLGFFKENGHTVVPSSSVIPHGDKTLLFTNAGMNQFKDIFTGKQKPSFPRATTAQKCIRAGGKHNDLDNVGFTARHLTFFEMLGNFSFGDYFKKDAIAFAWKLVTEEFQVPRDKLWITVFREDQEARDLWKKIAGVPDGRVVGLGEKDNFWSMGDVGPCGPCSEILVDRGDAFGAPDIENGERFFEIWNLVFMQFEQRADSTRVPLPRPSIDTGMGLERMAMVLQGAGSVFETDLFQPILGRIVEISGVPYDPGPSGVPHRVLADHVRSLVFAFADGAEPSNEGRGYVLRRILRRAARFGRKIHADGAMLHRLVEGVVEEMGEAFPQIREKQEFITRLIQSEEERFGETLDNGIQLFEEVVARMRAQGSTVIPGGEAFKLYDTFGFPVDLVEQMATEISFKVDIAGFEKLMEEQKERSRGASQFSVIEKSADALDLEKYPETRFVGYREKQCSSEVLAAQPLGETWEVLLSSTPFYGESGGQVGDSGSLQGSGFRLIVEDTKKERGRFIHCCRLAEGAPDRVKAGQVVEAAVDEERRSATERNHTATHLLHAALRQVLGTHAHQKGSLVDPARLRFDVTHFSSMKPEELEQVEDIVRRLILKNTPVETFEVAYDEARKLGAMALFGEKYGDTVRVVKIGNDSLELCGGTHVARTGDIGTFVLVSEGAVSSGVRRIEALTAEGAHGFQRKGRGILEDLAALLKVAPEAVLSRVQKILEENRELKTRKKALPAAGEAAGPEAVYRERVGSILFLTSTIPGADGKALRETYDRLKKEADEVIVALFGILDGKVQILVGVSSALVSKGWDARKVFEAGADRLSARGGGRPEMVQAGGAAPPGAAQEAAQEMLSAARRKASGQ